MTESKQTSQDHLSKIHETGCRAGSSRDCKAPNNTDADVATIGGRGMIIAPTSLLYLSAPTTTCANINLSAMPTTESTRVGLG